MKKLMIAAAVVLAGIAANAATVKWQQTKYAIGDGSDTGVVAEGTAAYLVQVTSSYTAENLIKMLADNGLDAVTAAIPTWKIDQTTVNSNNKVSKQDGSTDKLTAGGNEYAFMVIVNGDNVYVSDEKKASFSSTGGNDTYTFTFTQDDNDASWMPVMNAKTDGYQGAGWYSAAAIPEPTSGLLLLLGVAGLALRRRRA